MFSRRKSLLGVVAALPLAVALTGAGAAAAEPAKPERDCTGAAAADAQKCWHTQLETRAVQGTLTTIPASGGGQSTAQCPLGTRVTGGGFTPGDAATDLPLLISSAPVGDGWQVVVRNLNAAAPLTFSAYAVCAAIV